MCSQYVCRKKKPKLKNDLKTIYQVPYCSEALMNDRGFLPSWSWELNDLYIFYVTEVSRFWTRWITNSFHLRSISLLANEKLCSNFGSAHIEKPQRNIYFILHLFSQVSALLFQWDVWSIIKCKLFVVEAFLLVLRFYLVGP